MDKDTLNVAVVGASYWGKGVRTLSAILPLLKDVI
jgi:hypothetical protein